MFSPLKIISMVYMRKRPFMLNHKINIACDCRCKFCNSWRIDEDPDTLLDTSDVKDVLDQADEAGMLSYSMWGGEPLLREDSAEVMAYAHGKGMFTTISTNASLLAERAEELSPHTSLFLISLDGIGETHDKVRVLPGLFDKAVAGIEAVKKRGAKVRLFYNVNRISYPDVEEAARLARKLKLSIFYFPILHIPGYNENVLLDDEIRRETFGKILSLKRKGFPVLNLGSFLKVIRDGREARCRFPWYHVYLDYDGQLYTCDLGPMPEHKPAIWGDVRNTDLLELFRSEEWRGRMRELEGCNACRLSCAEIGSGSPLFQFPIRALTRLRHEWIFQAN